MLSPSSYQRMLRNEKNSLNSSFKMTCIILLLFFVFSLLCCKYICDIYLSMLDFNSLCKFNNIFTYLQDYRRHSVAVNQKRNDHMQVYNRRQIELFYINGLMVDRSTGPGLISLWCPWGWCYCTDFLVSLIIH